MSMNMSTTHVPHVQHSRRGSVGRIYPLIKNICLCLRFYLSAGIVLPNDVYDSLGHIIKFLDIHIFEHQRTLNTHSKSFVNLEI